MRFLLVILFSLNSLADEMKQHHALGETFGGEIASKAIQSATNLDTSILPDNFTSSPSEVKYSGQQLSSSQTFATNKDSEFIKQNFTRRPQFVLNKEQGIAVNGSNCVEVKDCKTTYNSVTCEEAIHSKEHSCTKDKIIKVHQPKIINEIIDLTIDTVNYDDTWFYVDMTTGELTSITGDKAGSVTATAHVSKTIPKSACPSLKINNHGASMISRSGFRTKRTRVAIIQTPTCENDLTTVVFIRQKRGSKWARRGGVFQFRIQYQPSRVIQSEYWQNHCGSLEDKASSGLCRLLREECIDGPATKNISGLKVQRDCWKKRLAYNCHFAKAKNNCGTYRKQGCEQINSECQQKTSGGLCAIHKQTYRCPTKNCTKTKTICAHSGYCQDGRCDTEASKPNQDFQKSITALSAIKEAGASLDAKLNQIFKGTRQTCRTAFGGFRNCCKDKGWGLDLNLTDCKSIEADLGLQKEKGQCHEVGKYCHKKILGKCIEKKKSYCCFQSKLGRIVQEQGRTQLKQHWGSGKHPICSGLTPEQLQQLDFSKMDLDEFYQDINNKAVMPNIQETSGKIKQRVEAFYRRQEP